MGTLDFVEVFSSIQGEGKYVGCRQLFVRLAGCNIGCDYCDTPDSRAGSKAGRVETAAGSREFVSYSNPIGADDFSRMINSLLEKPHHSVSFTGGEPLLQAEVLAKVMANTSGVVYLETNGTMPEKLPVVLNNVDIISMDIKLPSVVGREYWDEHRAFLRLATSSEVFVKIVLTGQTTDGEFLRAIDLVADVNEGIPVILQPVTPVHNVKGIAPEAVLGMQESALKQLRDVRVIPQTHKFMGQL